MWWIVCPLCGALVADQPLHIDWHAARGEHPPITPTPDPVPEPDPTPEEAP